MASKVLEMGLIMLFVAVICGGAAAQSSSGCTTALMSLSPCLTFVTGNSSSPSALCCSQLASVVQGSPQCLCSVLSSNGGASSIGITINQTLALALPGACKVQTPPVSQCNSSATTATTQATSPVASPAASPSSSPADETPTAAADAPAVSENPSVAGNTGSKTVPSATAGSSAGNIASVPFHLVLFFVFVSACASTMTKF